MRILARLRLFGNRTAVAVRSRHSPLENRIVFGDYRGYDLVAVSSQ
jgi:hypothetical protein